MTAPLISVVIPVYNCERYLSEAIASVLAQTYSPLEVIVVDDGSTDGSAKVAKSFGPPVFCVSQEHGGIGAARNRGLEHARGELLSFLDADDYWPDYKLAIQADALCQDAGLDMVFGSAMQFLSPELSEEFKRRIHCPREAMPALLAQAILIWRSSFQQVGFFDPSLRAGESIDWIIRARELGLRSRILPEVVLYRRLHKSNHGIIQKEPYTDYLRIVKASLDRRRAGSMVPGPGAASGSGPSSNLESADGYQIESEDSKR